MGERGTGLLTHVIKVAHFDLIFWVLHCLLEKMPLDSDVTYGGKKVGTLIERVKY